MVLFLVLSLSFQLHASLLTADGRHTMNQTNTVESWINFIWFNFEYILCMLSYLGEMDLGIAAFNLNVTGLVEGRKARGEWEKHCISQLTAWFVLDDRRSIIYCRRLFFIVACNEYATLKWHFWIWFNPCTFHISINCSRRINFVCWELIRLAPKTHPASHMMNDVIYDEIYANLTIRKLVLN